jgi:homoserine O-acetyltransferase
MTFHADGPVSDFDASVDPLAPGACTTLDGECSVRLAPFHGGEPRDVRVRYALYGAIGSPVIVVQGGISATRHASTQSRRDGWWDALVGPDRAIDTDRFRVLSIEWLDRSDFEGAAAVRAIGSEDQADAIALLIGALGIDRLHAFVGASYGAMVGIAFAARYPAKLRRLVAIAGAHRAHPLAIAVRNVQRAIVRLGARHGDEESGLDLARRLAMTTYRSEREFAERCAAAPLFRDGRYRFAEEDWLESVGASFSRHFAAARFLALSESIDLHAIAPEDVYVPTTLIGFSSDRVVPLSDLCELQLRCGAPAPLHVIDSRYGHDAFLKEPDKIGPLIADALDNGSRE